MTLKLWSFGHIFYILSPFIIFALMCFLLRGRSRRTIDTVGYIIGALSVMILVIRNIDIFLRNGWEVEVIPLQVCHVGSAVAGLALILRRKWLMLTSFCFNMIPAVLAMIFADSLANYDTIFRIRAQAYVWGHILIVLCALYGIFFLRPKFSRSDLFKSLSFVGVIAVTAIICNSLFREKLGWSANYFYLFDYKGTPLKFLYEVFPPSRYGWFEINWFYVCVLLAVFVAVFVALYFLAKLIVRRLEKIQACKKNGVHRDAT